MKLSFHGSTWLVCVAFLLIDNAISSYGAAIDASSVTKDSKMVHKKRMISDKHSKAEQQVQNKREMEDYATRAISENSLVKRDDWGVYDESYGMADAATGADSVYDLGQNCGFAPAWEVAGLPPPPDYDPNDCIPGGGGGDYGPDGYDWSQADEEDYSDDDLDEASYDSDDEDDYDDGGDDTPTVAATLPLICVGICL